jgi:hypothetical protein
MVAAGSMRPKGMMTLPTRTDSGWLPVRWFAAALTIVRAGRFRARRVLNRGSGVRRGRCVAIDSPSA